MTNEQCIEKLEKEVAELKGMVAAATTTVKLKFDGKAVARELAPNMSEELSRLSATRQ